MEIPNCTVLSSLCVVISSMEYASLVVEPRKPSFSSKVSPYSAPESRPLGCFAAPSPSPTGLPSRQSFRFPRSTPYRVSGESLSLPRMCAVMAYPARPTSPSICGSRDPPKGPRVLGFAPSTHSLSDHSWMVPQSFQYERGDHQASRVTRESHPTLYSLQLCYMVLSVTL